ncbi:hypothetical protein AAVH_33344 [Aphelenchoides avenae]|nr:hypothetical protein AAVH_33344 [Aphelenchus avenae]
MLDAGKSFNEIFKELTPLSDAGPQSTSDFFDPEEHMRVSKEKESREYLDRFTKEETSDSTVLYKCSFDGCPYTFEATGVKELLDIRRPLVGHYRGKHLNALRRHQRLKVADSKRKWKKKKKGKKSRRQEARSSTEIPSHALDDDFYCYAPPTNGPIRRSHRNRAATKREDAQMSVLEREDQPSASTVPAEVSTSHEAIVEPPPTYIILILPPDEPSTSSTKRRRRRRPSSLSRRQ